MMNAFSLKGKTILVTGASSGIGRGIAIECSKMGAQIILNGRDENRLNETLGMMEGEVLFLMVVYSVPVFLRFAQSSISKETILRRSLMSIRLPR